MPMANKGLAKLTEEIGELGQVVGKVLAVNLDLDKSHWDGGKPLAERLEEEIADVIAACEFVATKFGLNKTHIANRSVRKVTMFEAFDRSED